MIYDDHALFRLFFGTAMNLVATTCVNIYPVKDEWIRIVKIKATTFSVEIEILLLKEIQSICIDVSQSDKLDSDYVAKLINFKLKSFLIAAAEFRKLNAFLFEHLVQEGIVTVKKKEESP